MSIIVLRMNETLRPGSRWQQVPLSRSPTSQAPAQKRSTAPTTGGGASPLVRACANTSASTSAPLRRSRDFGLVFTGAGVSALGSYITYVAIPYQVYVLTNSPLLVGLMGVCELVPLLFMAFVGGALADYLDRRLLIILGELAFTALTGALLAQRAARTGRSSGCSSSSPRSPPRSTGCSGPRWTRSSRGWCDPSRSRPRAC